MHLCYKRAFSSGCPRSLINYSIATWYSKMDKTSWTYSIVTYVFVLCHFLERIPLHGVVFCHPHTYLFWLTTVCPGSSDPPEKILNIFAPENEVYTIF